MRTLRVRGLAICRLTVWTTCCSQIDRADPEYLALIEIYQINRAEAQFRSVKKRYGTLQELGRRGANLISRDLGDGADRSYIFSVPAGDTTYTLRARSKRWEQHARRCFYSDQTGIVRQNRTNSEANAESEQVY